MLISYMRDVLNFNLSFDSLETKTKAKRDPSVKGVAGFSFNLQCSQLIHTSRRHCNNDRQHKERRVPPHVGLQYLKRGARFFSLSLSLTLSMFLFYGEATATRVS